MNWILRMWSRLTTSDEKASRALASLRPDEATTVAKAVARIPVTDLTPANVIEAVKAVMPERVGGAVWVDIKGNVDKGVTIDILKKDKASLMGLIGRDTFGSALGYRFARQGNISASVFAGATHRYSGVLAKGWTPVGGVTLKF